MSQIFDALRQTETERSGAALSGAKELLEVVERKATEMPSPIEAPRQSVALESLKSYQTVKVVLPLQSKLVCISDQESLAAEKFRFLSIRLRHLQQKKLVKRILVTSSMAGEGKSTVACNLACALASSKQQKVLILEGDLRRPSLALQLGLGQISGLSELLEAEPGEPANLYQLENLNLWILPAGNPLRNPLTLMQPGRLATLMDKLSALFDWIVIDSPPVLPLADTSIWMRLADSVLLVTRPGTTAKRQLQQSLESVEQSKLLGAILNGSKEATANNHYYYAGRTAPVQPQVLPTP
jgi:capsular exopolysaccharide synthesis family protein